MEDLRKEFGSEWFLHRKGIEVLGLPLVMKPAHVFGDAARALDLCKYEGLDFARARLNAALPSMLPAYEPLRVRPFRFLARKSEFVKDNRRVGCPYGSAQLFCSAAIRLEAKTIELAEGRLEVVVALDVRMQWDIDASLHELMRLKVPLEGLYVIRRETREGERRLLGGSGAPRRTALN